MTSPLSSAQAARTALATRLRHLRLDAGLAGHQLSRACGWHPAKTSRIENTRAVPSDADIRAWCAACGADGQAEDLIAAAPRSPARPAYGIPSPEVVARAERGLARFLADQDDKQESTTDGGNA